MTSYVQNGGHDVISRSLLQKHPPAATDPPSVYDISS